MLCRVTATHLCPQTVPLGPLAQAATCSQLREAQPPDLSLPTSFSILLRFWPGLKSFSGGPRKIVPRIVIVSGPGRLSLKNLIETRSSCESPILTMGTLGGWQVLGWRTEAPWAHVDPECFLSGRRLQMSLDSVAQAKRQFGTRVWTPAWAFLCLSQLRGEGGGLSWAGRMQPVPSQSQEEGGFRPGVNAEGPQDVLPYALGGSLQAEEVKPRLQGALPRSPSPHPRQAGASWPLDCSPLVPSLDCLLPMCVPHGLGAGEQPHGELGVLGSPGGRWF